MTPDLPDMPPPPPHGGAPLPPSPPPHPSPRPPGQPYYGGPPARSNGLAVVSLIFSILGIVCILPFVGSVVGVITGHVARSQIARSGDAGAGAAQAGIIIGYVGLALVMIFVALWLLVVGGFLVWLL